MHPHRARLTLVLSAMLVAYTGANEPAPPATPNVVVNLSADLLSAYVNLPIDRTQPVASCILGTSLRGTGRTIAGTRVELHADACRAAVELVVEGESFTTSIGRKKPVCTYSDAEYCFDARLPVWVDDRGLRAGKATSRAKGKTRLNGLKTDYRGLLDRLVTRIALRIYERDKDLALWISERQAEERYAKGLEDDLAPRLQEGQADFEKNVTIAREKYGLTRLGLSTTPHAVQVAASLGQANPAAAFDGPPPEWGFAVHVRMHESAAQQLASADLKGRTLTEKDLRQPLPEFLRGRVEVAKDPAPKDDRPWSVTLDEEAPVVVRFRDGKVEVQVRVSRFTTEDREDPGMNVTARYRLQGGPEGFTAVREGDLEIFPPGFVPGSGKPLTLFQQSQKRVLRNRLEPGLPTRVTLPEVTPFPERLKRMGSLKLVLADAQAGWLVVGWRRVSAAEGRAP